VSELAVTALADRLRPRSRPSAVKCSTPPETNIVSGTTLKLACGPSAPQVRTVRSSSLKSTRDNNVSGTNCQKEGGPSAPQGRTIRAPGADRPPFILEIHQRQQCLWYKLSNSRRTVRTPGADRPPHRSSPQLEKTPSLVHFELERRTVRPPGPDCPPVTSNFHQSQTCSLVRVRTVRAPGRGLSALVQSALKLVLFQILSKRR